MSNSVFRTSGTNRILAQPQLTTVIVIRSTSAADTGNMDFTGAVGASYSTETLALLGTVETNTDNGYDTISQIMMDSPAIGTVTGMLPGTAAVGDVRFDSNPADGDWIRIGTTSSYVQYRFKTSIASAGDVLIGADRFATADNLSSAINLGAGVGTKYHVGTVAGIVTSSLSVDVLTLTDKQSCNRQDEWDIQESAASFSKRNPTGGVDGSTVFSIPPGQTTAADPLTFASESHADVTLPSLMLATSVTVNLAGAQSMLRVWGDQSLKFKVQTSTDQINWWDTSEGEVTLTASTMTYIMLSELHESIRFVITENLNTTGTVLDARVIY